MWAIWITTAGIAAAGFYALVPTTHVVVGPPEAPLAVAGDMALYRSLLVNYVTSHHAATGAVPQSDFIQNGNWNYAPTRWQNYVMNGTVVVYPAPGGLALPQGFAAALVDESRYSVEAGVVQAGGVVNAANAGSAVELPAGFPASVTDGTPVWIAKAF